MSADVPLLNDYKRNFVRNRLCQTFLGGIRLFGVPWYTIILQIFVFLIPIIPVISFYFIEEPHWLNYLFFAIIIVILSLIFQICGKLLHYRIIRQINSSNSDNQLHDVTINELLSEENTVQIQGCLSLMSFLIPCKKNWLNILLHSLIAGLMAFSVGPLFRPSDTFIPVVLVQIFSWYSILQAYYSLILVNPPEIATFRVHDSLGIVYFVNGIRLTETANFDPPPIFWLQKGGSWVIIKIG